MTAEPRRYAARFLALLTLLMLAKGIIAARLDPFGDEAFYWQCAQRPALHHADHPFMTATLVRAGTWLLGDTPLGVRFVFLLLAVLFPFVILSLARPLVGERDAWLAAGATLVIPATAHIGLIAIPDVPLLLFGALAMLGLERGTRGGSSASPDSRRALTGLGGWLLAGVAMAFGLATHYRFVLVPLGALLYLVLTRAGRTHWRRPGPWIAAAGVALGLIPALAHNFSNGFAAVRYYLAGRHGGRLEPAGVLKHVLEQAAIVTPLLYLVLIGILIELVRRSLRGEDRARLLALLALPYLVLFLLASPFHDVRLATLHWPVPGYLPLLVYLPATLHRLAERRPSRAWRLAVALVPASGAMAVALGVGALASGGHALPATVREFEGWSEVAERVRTDLETIEATGGRRKVVVADNYKLGANLELALGSEADVFVLDHPLNHLHGRASAFDRWGIGETALASRAGEEGLLVMEVGRTGWRESVAWRTRVQGRFERLEPLGELRLGKGRRKVFLFYRGLLVSFPTGGR